MALVAKPMNLSLLSETSPPARRKVSLQV